MTRKLLPLALMLAWPALAQDAPRAADVPPVPPMAPTSAAASAQAFTTAESASIRDWYQKHPAAQAADPVKIAAAAAISRGEPIPPRGSPEPVPEQLEALLAFRPGHRIVLVGPAVVLVETASGTVRDLLRDGAAPRE